MINIPNKNINRRGVFNKTVVKEPEVPIKKKPRFKLKLKKISFKNKLFTGTFFRKRKKWVIGSVAVLLLIIGGVGYSYYNYLYQNDPRVIYAKKLQTLTQSVSKYMKLPTNETPVTATVTDVATLPNELFFKYAKDGDKIIMYKKDKLAILFRPSTGQVITEALLEFKDVPPTPVPSISAVAGASTSALVQEQSISITPKPTSSYIPQGKILVMPH